MARSSAEIQTDIAMTRRLVERQLDAIERRVPRGRWMPLVSAVGALALGMLLSRVSFLRLVGIGAKSTQAGLMVARTVASMDRYVADRRRSLAA